MHERCRWKRADGYWLLLAISRFFQSIKKRLPRLRDFRCDHDLAVRLIRVPRVVRLVILLSRIEDRKGNELSDDWIVPRLVLLELGDRVLGRLLLLRRVIQNHRSILRSDVVALSIERGRIVDREEDTQKIAERNNRRIERHLHDLGVASRAAAHFLV